MGNINLILENSLGTRSRSKEITRDMLMLFRREGLLASTRVIVIYKDVRTVRSWMYFEGNAKWKSSHIECECKKKNNQG